MTIQMIIAAVLIALGFLLMLSSLIGIVRFPDFFARLHAQGVGDTLGAFLILAGMMAAVGANLLSVKLLLIFIIIVLTNPIGTNLMMIAAINKEDYLGYRTFMEGGEDKPETADHDSGHEEKKQADNDKEEIKEQKDSKIRGSKKQPQNRKRKPSMNMNKAELLEAAAERGIEVPEEATKREILDLIYSSHDKNRR